MITAEYSEAAVEVLGILGCMEESDQKKIPNEVLEFLQNNQSKTYHPDIDYMDAVENLELKSKTREILAGIYLDYLCPTEEKESYLNRLKENERQYQEQLKKKYNAEDIFKNRQKENKVEKTALAVEKKEPLWMRIIKKIKAMFSF